MKLLALLLLATALHAQVAAPAQTPPAQASPEKIIIDTDIGDDVDDAFAIALALRSPEVELMGVTTTFGDTEARARIADRLLAESGHPHTVVAAGVPSPIGINNVMSQRRYGEGGHYARPTHPAAVEFIVDQVRRFPGQITLVAIGPLMNVGALIDRDPVTFRQLRRVILMGGSVKRGYGDMGYAAPRGPEAEWNIKNDITSARKLFNSGVPLYVMPLDSTQLKLDEIKRPLLFQAGTPITDALTLLYHEWGQQTPTLFDAMTVAYLVDPKLCPVTAMHIEVDEKGFTRAEAGPANAQVCLDSDSEAFFRFYIPRVAGK